MSAIHRIGILFLVGFAFVIGSVWQFAGAQGEKEKFAVQKWEYKTARAASELDTLGADGWELVSVGQPEARLVYFYLKRPKP